MKNHKKVFPEIKVENTLDEELMEILLNFNLDEVHNQDHLDEKTRQMVILACTIASQTPKRYEILIKIMKTLLKIKYTYKNFCQIIALEIIIQEMD